MYDGGRTPSAECSVIQTEGGLIRLLLFLVVAAVTNHYTSLRRNKTVSTSTCLCFTARSFGLSPLQWATLVVQKSNALLLIIIKATPTIVGEAFIFYL